VAIAATSYVDGASTTEIAAYVGTTGAIKLGTIVNDGAATWVTISAPAGKQLSGELALGTVFQAGVRKLVIAATTTTADLYRYVSTGGNTGTWTDATNGQVWVTNTQLAITTNPGATILSIFGSINPPTHRLGMVRYDGSWAFTNLGRPAGKSVCNGISAVQGPTSTLVAGTYRFQVVCTPPNSSLAEVYIAEAANDSTTTFTWSTLAVPSGALPTLATSVRRVAPPSSIAFESYFATPSNKHLIKVPNAATSVVDLGVPPDIDSLHKGLVAVPYYGGSRAVYVGGANGQGRLYERRGFEAGNIPQYYRALGDMNASLPFTSSGNVRRDQGVHVARHDRAGDDQSPGHRPDRLAHDPDVADGRGDVHAAADGANSSRRVLVRLHGGSHGGRHGISEKR
jgi:hypothetical protein